ncbi:hypothetical protein EG329_008069 [Mollisiaceae sp. DMI_Dod_QoI]|nr:hypothetical protein EG329_008069 [Helotiales sp. DMI_Dod_QoI]
MPPKLIAQYAPPAGGPVYQIWQGDKLQVLVDSIVVITDHNHRIDRHQFKSSGKVNTWHRRTGGVGGPTQLYNNTVHSNVLPGLAAFMEPRIGDAVDTTGGNNPNHSVVIMANINNVHPLPNPHLRKMYRIIMRRADALPPAAVAGNPWRVRPRAIAFELIGSTPLRWNLEDAAEHGLRGLHQFFTDPTRGAARRARWTRIILLVPSTPAREPARVRRAWERAIGRWVTAPPQVPAAEPTPNPTRRSLRNVQR